MGEPHSRLPCQHKAVSVCRSQLKAKPPAHTVAPALKQNAMIALSFEMRGGNGIV